MQHFHDHSKLLRTTLLDQSNSQMPTDLTQISEQVGFFFPSIPIYQMEAIKALTKSPRVKHCWCGPLRQILYLQQTLRPEDAEAVLPLGC